MRTELELFFMSWGLKTAEGTHVIFFEKGMLLHGTVTKVTKKNVRLEKVYHLKPDGNKVWANGADDGYWQFPREKVGPNIFFKSLARG
jgi:hypothetical protein